MPLEVDFNAQFGQKEGEYRQKLAVTIKKFDLEEQLTGALGLVLGPYGITARKRRDSEESEDTIPIHIESGVRGRYGYYDQPKVRAESWLPEMKSVPSSYNPSIAYPPERLNVTYHMKTSLRNDYKADFSSSWSGNYGDIEDEKPVEIVPVAKVESANFKNFSTCWGRKSPDENARGWGDSDGGGWGESGDENEDSGWDSKPRENRFVSESSTDQKEDIWTEFSFAKVLFPLKKRANFEIPLARLYFKADRSPNSYGTKCCV